jgi:hypothetical protein
MTTTGPLGSEPGTIKLGERVDAMMLEEGRGEAAAWGRWGEVSSQRVDYS